MKDDSIMKFGKHKGEALANIPASYFVWLHTQDYCRGDLKDYIEDNFEVTVKK